jgi:amidase
MRILFFKYNNKLNNFFYFFEINNGLSIMAGAYQEPMVLSLAYAFEQATLHRAAPKFIKSSNFSSGI